MLRFSILMLAGVTAFAQQYTISTVAGGAPPATPVTALSASIGQPRKLAIAGSNLYFSSGNAVFKIDASGTLTLIAGNSRAGFSGDGGPAACAGPCKRNVGATGREPVPSYLRSGPPRSP